MSLAWNVQLPPRDKLVLLALADNANDEGECFPSIATISRRACTDERRTYRILKSLESANQITRVSRPGRSTLYKVHPTPGIDATPGTGASPNIGTTPGTGATPGIGTTPGTGAMPPLAQVPATPGTGATHNLHLTTKEPSRRAASGEPDSIDKALFVEARKVFGQSIGGKINQAIREKGKPWVLDMIEKCRNKDPEAARAYLAAALQERSRGVVV